MDMFWTNRFLSNPLNFLILLLAFTAFLHLVLVWPRNRPLKFWKYVDYIWLSLATIGVLGAASNVRITVAANWAVQEKTQGVFSLRLVKDVFYTDPESHYFGMKFIKTDNSPPDFEETQKQYDIAHEWYQEAWRFAQDINVPELPDISLQDFPPINFNHGSLNETVDWLKKRIDDYSVERLEYLDTEKLAAKKEWEETLATSRHS